MGYQLSLYLNKIPPYWVFFNLFILRERARKQRRGRGENPKQVLHCQFRAQSGARSHKPWDHDLGWTQGVWRLTHWATPVPLHSFNIKYDAICRFFIDTFNRLRKLPPISSLLSVFIMKGCLAFCPMVSFFASWDDHCGFFLFVLWTWFIALTHFLGLNHLEFLRQMPLGHGCNPFDALLDLVSHYFVEDLGVYIHNWC